jgi:AcrR family transcriptional regulator
MEPKTNRKIAQGQATRQQIVGAATRLFTKPGYEATSIEAVLRESAVSRGALYHHFASKEALFAAVLDQAEADVAAAIVRASRGIADPVRALRAGCKAWLDLARDPMVRQVVLIDAPAVVGWEAWREIEARYSLALIKAPLRKLAAAGQVRADLVDVLAHMLLAALNEVALMIARADEPAKATKAGQAAVEQLIGRLLDG